MKTIGKYLFSSLFLLLAVHNSNGADVPFQRTIKIIGLGDTIVRPDFAEVVLVINKPDSNTLIGKQKVDSIATLLIKTMKTNKAIDSNSIISNYKYDKNGNMNSRYIRIILKDITNIDQFLNKMLSSGITAVDQLAYESSNEIQLKLEALKKAIENAKNKAESISKQNNLKIGKINQIEEQMVGPSGPDFYQKHSIIHIKSMVNVIFEIK